MGNFPFVAILNPGVEEVSHLLKMTKLMRKQNIGGISKELIKTTLIRDVRVQILN